MSVSLINTENIKHKKLFKAHRNNIIISDKNLLDKYTYFEDSKVDESRTLLFEIENKPKNFKRYSRGEIVRVKFGVNIGSEFSGDHFAIVISKQDTMRNSTLHVIPITSKKHKKSLEIGPILFNQNEIDKLKKMLNRENNLKSRKEINNVINYYLNRKNTISYACIDHLKTVSKLSVSKTLFKKYDYLPNIKCSDEIMKKIYKKILDEYI